jgi:hypothetical protein
MTTLINACLTKGRCAVGGEEHYGGNYVIPDYIYPREP